MKKTFVKAGHLACNTQVRLDVVRINGAVAGIVHFNFATLLRYPRFDFVVRILIYIDIPSPTPPFVKGRSYINNLHFLYPIIKACPTRWSGRLSYQISSCCEGWGSLGGNQNRSLREGALLAISAMTSAISSDEQHMYSLKAFSLLWPRMLISCEMEKRLLR